MIVNLFTFAYLDPGTGSLIVQAVIGAVAGVTVFGRNAVRKVSDTLRGKKPAAAEETKDISKDRDKDADKPS